MTSKKIHSPPAKKPWPTKAAMEQVYANSLWGTNDSKFYSGEGSHDPLIISPYLEAVQKFLLSFKQKLSVCDLGCGDFNIGKEIVDYTSKYIAVDIVADLIKFNKAKFQRDHLEFRCLDIVKDDLPPADCLIIRQVLQHISNAEIQQILSKVTTYEYLILTEHLPQGEFTPNLDIISGQGTRLKKNSGVVLTEAPFDLKVTEQTEISNIILKSGKGRISTTLFRLQ